MKTLGYGTLLRTIRRQQGKTMKEVADACGVSEGLIGRWERGEINPTLKAYNQALNVLGYKLLATRLEELEEEER